MIVRLFILLLAAMSLTVSTFGATADLTLTVTPATSGGACPGGDSGFVPAGYHCLTASTDEFNGTSVDTTKWSTSGNGGLAEGSGYLAESMKWNGSAYTSAGVSSLFTLPDGPMYIEWRRRVVPFQTNPSLMQIWTCGGPGTTFCQAINHGSTIYAEQDMDMGFQCSTVDPGATAFYSLCSQGYLWQSGTCIYCNILSSADGPALNNNSNWWIIGMKRDPNPAPNGTITYYVNGTAVKTSQFPAKYWVSPSQGGSGTKDVLIMELFCANNCSTSGSDMELDIDYVRVYCPTCS